MDDEIFRTLKKRDILDAAIIAQMDLTPEQFMQVSTTLLVLNWLKAVAKDEGISIENMDQKFVIKRILGRDLSDKEVEAASRMLIERTGVR